MGGIIDGRALSDTLNKELELRVRRLKVMGIIPKLAVILAGDNAASVVYVKNKEKSAKKIGILSEVERYPVATEEEILKRIEWLNKDASTHGILVQLPLPEQIDENKVLLAIDPQKDVDGFHPINIGKLVTNQECLKPCTPSGIIHLIKSTGIEIKGKNAVVIGRSNIVGKPVALMLLNEHATVTICHSRTADLQEIVRCADILVAAIGRPEFIRGDWVKPGSIVIDVGINRKDDGTLTGDVQFESAKKRAAFITPVPGGVGPMTISMLMMNTICAAEAASKEK